MYLGFTCLLIWDNGDSWQDINFSYLWVCVCLTVSAGCLSVSFTRLPFDRNKREQSSEKTVANIHSIVMNMSLRFSLENVLFARLLRIILSLLDSVVGHSVRVWEWERERRGGRERREREVGTRGGREGEERERESVCTRVLIINASQACLFALSLSACRR